MIYFLFGILFAYLVLPLIENVSTIFTQLTELICMKIASKTFKIKKSLEEEPEHNSQVIGFQYTPQEEYYYDEEEE